METNENIFEYATRNKLRFTSTRGELTVEQLWDVPLRSRDDFNLNTVAQAANKALEDASKANFVEKTKTIEHARREKAMALVKYVIDTKLAEEEAAKTRLARKQEKEQLLQALAEKKAGKLTEMTEKELERRIRALED